MIFSQDLVKQLWPVHKVEYHRAVKSEDTVVVQDTSRSEGSRVRSLAGGVHVSCANAEGDEGGRGTSVAHVRVE